MLLGQVLSTDTSFRSKVSEKRRIPTPTQMKRQSSQSSTPRSENSILLNEKLIPKVETSAVEFNLKKAIQSQKGLNIENRCCFNQKCIRKRRSRCFLRRTQTPAIYFSFQR